MKRARILGVGDKNGTAAAEVMDIREIEPGSMNPLMVPSVILTLVYLIFKHEIFQISIPSLV